MKLPHNSVGSELSPNIFVMGFGHFVESPVSWIMKQGKFNLEL